MSPHFSKSKRVEDGWSRWFNLRTIVYGRCAYCGVPLVIPADTDDNTPNIATLDHIHPRCRGGSVTVWSCLRCNRDKTHLTLNEWRFALMVRRHRPVLFAFEKRIPSTLIGYVVNHLVYVLPKLPVL